uniref:Uncharacterized protein n=1 Tax=Oryza brachyantha TaxID=4533 RepID=J3L182_ORYBR
MKGEKNEPADSSRWPLISQQREIKTCDINLVLRNTRRKKKEKEEEAEHVHVGFLLQPIKISDLIGEAIDGMRVIENWIDADTLANSSSTMIDLQQGNFLMILTIL